VHVALKKEQDLNELKTKFLSLVSHEFKTPLAGISTSATLAGKYTREEQQGKREKHLATIKNKVKYLNNIIDDFLSIERLDTGKTNYCITSFSLSTVINQVIDDVAMLLKQGQTIKCDAIAEDFHIHFDEKIMELVISNLLYNAIKYSGEESTVEINCEVEQDQLQIHVVDEGIGIPEKEQEFIFNRYFRAENALLNAGTGIGLNIVKNHLESLGGSISFFSKINQGSTFSITIPTNNKGQHEENTPYRG
jgi:signal transduction histidine kinase